MFPSCTSVQIVFTTKRRRSPFTATERAEYPRRFGQSRRCAVTRAFGRRPVSNLIVTVLARKGATRPRSWPNISFGRSVAAAGARCNQRPRRNAGILDAGFQGGQEPIACRSPFKSTSGTKLSAGEQEHMNSRRWCFCAPIPLLIEYYRARLVEHGGSDPSFVDLPRRAACTRRLSRPSED